MVKMVINKKQCQLCKKLNGQIVPVSLGVLSCVYIMAIFGMVVTKKNHPTGDPRTNLHLTTEETVFCNLAVIKMTLLVMMLMEVVVVAR